MNMLSQWILAAVLGLGIAEYVAGTEQPSAESGGKIVLYENSGSGDECTIDIVSGINHYYMGDSGCKQDQYTYFKLQDVKSAIWILFGSENWSGSPRCPRAFNDSGNEGWQDEIKTIKNNFNSMVMDLQELDGAEVGKVFKPGIIKTYAFEDDGVPHKGKLSCVSTFWCPASAGDPTNCHDPNHVIEHDSDPTDIE